MDKQSKILITGASGLIGSALVRLLKIEEYSNVTCLPLGFDLIKQHETLNYFEDEKPEYAFHLAAEVGGIAENNNRSATFIYKNTVMQCNIFRAACKVGVKKILFPGSACAYPAITDRLIVEDDFLLGKPESTNLAYAVAKQNGIVMAQSCAKQYGMGVVLPMVANTYGKNDKSTHVIPMMMEKIRKSREVNEIPIFWGTGKPLREFIHADDVAAAFLFLMRSYNSLDIINVGTGVEYSIDSLAYNIAAVMGASKNFGWDTSKPDGMMRKCLDSSKLRSMGWTPKINLEDGLRGLI